MSSGNKVAKYRRRKSINVGVIVFLIIFIYVIINIYIYFTKDHLTIYEVKEGSTSDDNVFNGLILRDEEIITTGTSGYINYYHRDGERVAKNSTIYTIDENKSATELISNTEETAGISSNNNANIKKEIINFQKRYHNSIYSSVYDFKYNMDNTILEIVNDNMLSNLKSAMKEEGTSTTFQVVKTKSSGIITYSMDNMENLSADTVTADNFKPEKHKAKQLRTMELIESGSPVYKIVKNDKWSILLLLKEEQYNKLKEKESVSITFSEDGLTTTAPITVYRNGNTYFARLDLNKFMIRYINERYISVEIAVNSATGLKIPGSSIVKKDFYQIPLEYFTEGGNSGSLGLTKGTYDKNGNIKYKFIPTDIYYSDEKYGYIDARLFELNDWITSKNSGKKYTISKMKSLEGAFNVNKGYAIFRRIEILYENEEYCIIKKGTPYGLSIYDHIALKGNTAVEQEIIY